MIKASDLRIGNFVHYKCHDELDERKEWDEVDKLDAYELMCIAAGYNENYSYIPLTDEWLIKFGYTSDGDMTGWKAPKAHYRISDLVGVGCYAFAHGHAFTHTLHYVHQLQNLHFAITGQELSVKNEI